MSDADERRSERTNVVLTASLQAGGVWVPVRVGNLSAHGALVIGDTLPAEGEQITFRCKGHDLQSWVAWVRAPHAGVQFCDPINPADLLPCASRPGPVITKDTRELDFRRPGFRRTRLTDEEWRIVQEFKQRDPATEEDARSVT